MRDELLGDLARQRLVEPARHVDGGEFREFAFGLALRARRVRWPCPPVSVSACELHRHVLARRHRHRAGDQARDAGQQDGCPAARRRPPRRRRGWPPRSCRRSRQARRRAASRCAPRGVIRGVSAASSRSPLVLRWLAAAARRGGRACSPPPCNQSMLSLSSTSTRSAPSTCTRPRRGNSSSRIR